MCYGSELCATANTARHCKINIKTQREYAGFKRCVWKVRYRSFSKYRYWHTCFASSREINSTALRACPARFGLSCRRASLVKPSDAHLWHSALVNKRRRLPIALGPAKLRPTVWFNLMSPRSDLKRVSRAQSFGIQIRFVVGVCRNL